jgi:hypothetical protein
MVEPNVSTVLLCLPHRQRAVRRFSGRRIHSDACQPPLEGFIMLLAELACRGYVISRKMKGSRHCLASLISLAISVTLEPSVVYRSLKLLNRSASARQASILGNDYVRPRDANLSALCKRTEAPDPSDTRDGGWIRPPMTKTSNAGAICQLITLSLMRAAE